MRNSDSSKIIVDSAIQMSNTYSYTNTNMNNTHSYSNTSMNNTYSYTNTIMNSTYSFTNTNMSNTSMISLSWSHTHSPTRIWVTPTQTQIWVTIHDPPYHGLMLIHEHRITDMRIHTHHYLTMHHPADALHATNNWQETHSSLLDNASSHWRLKCHQ